MASAKGTIVLFDVDGTLTAPRQARHGRCLDAAAGFWLSSLAARAQKAPAEMLAFLQQLRKVCPLTCEQIVVQWHSHPPTHAAFCP